MLLFGIKLGPVHDVAGVDQQLSPQLSVLKEFVASKGDVSTSVAPPFRDGQMHIHTYAGGAVIDPVGVDLGIQEAFFPVHVADLPKIVDQGVFVIERRSPPALFLGLHYVHDLVVRVGGVDHNTVLDPVAAPAEAVVDDGLVLFDAQAAVALDVDVLHPNLRSFLELPRQRNAPGGRIRSFALRGDLDQAIALVDIEGAHGGAVAFNRRIGEDATFRKVRGVLQILFIEFTVADEFDGPGNGIFHHRYVCRHSRSFWEVFDVGVGKELRAHQLPQAFATAIRKPVVGEAIANREFQTVADIARVHNLQAFDPDGPDSTCRRLGQAERERQQDRSAGALRSREWIRHGQTGLP